MKEEILAQEKVHFVRMFKRFVSGGFKLQDFTLQFYQRLCGLFGFIAHYNQEGFYQTYFVSVKGQVQFISKIHQWTPMGSWSDVEAEIKVWVALECILEKVVQLRNDEIEREERAEYKRLKAKYG